MSAGSKTDSSVSTRVENLVDLLVQIPLNSEEEVNGGNGGDSDAKAKNLKFTYKPQTKSLIRVKKMKKLATKKAVECFDMAKVLDHKGFVDLRVKGSTDIIGRMAMSADGIGERHKVIIDDAEMEIKHNNIYAPPDDWRPKDQIKV